MAEAFVKQLFDYLNSSVGHHMESAKNLKEFLGFLAKMQSPVSIRNKLLTYGYNPAATDIHTKEEWEKFGIRVLDENAMIYNLQKKPESPLGYEERIMYDISSTDATGKVFETFPNAGFFAERLLMYPPCPVQFREGNLEGNRKANLNLEKSVIEVTNGFKDEIQVCHNLLREYAHYHLSRMEKQGTYDREKHSVEAIAVSYAVCIRYDVEPPKIDVVTPPEGKAEDRMEVLKGLDSVLGMISQQIEEGGRNQMRFLAQEAAVKNPQIVKTDPSQGQIMT